MMKIDITKAEYAAALWKANHERNKRFEEEKKQEAIELRQQKMLSLAQMM
jgi:hypothetical protein